VGKYEPASVRDPAGSRMTKARKVADEIRREIIALADLQDAQDELAAALCRACAHRVGGRCDFDSMRLFSAWFDTRQLAEAMDITAAAKAADKFRYFAGIVRRWRRFGYGNYGPPAEAA